MTAPAQEIIAPAPGVQVECCQSTVYELLIGGQLGGGKSFILVFDAMNQVHFSDYRAVIFRRSLGELKDMLDIAQRVYLSAYPGTKYNISERKFTFPSGATITFSFAENMEDALRWRGREVQYCVGRGTQIKMADGSTKAIEDVQVGDLVLTLNGPSPVTHTPPSRLKPCLQLTACGESIIVGQDHTVLTPHGWQASYNMYTSKLAQVLGSTVEQIQGLLSEFPQPSRCSHTGLPPIPSVSAQSQEADQTLEFVSWSKDGRNDCGESGDEHLKISQLPVLSVPVMLHTPVPQSKELAFSRWSPQRVTSCEPTSQQQAPSFQSYYPPLFDFYGGQALQGKALERARDNTPSQVCAEGDYYSYRPYLDDPGNTPKHNPGGLYRYSHPYTKDSLVSSEGACCGDAYIVPVGVQEVFDLTVLNYSHYITSNNIIHKNCGIDELGDFDWDVYEFLKTRVRYGGKHRDRMKLYVRASCNPEGRCVPYGDVLTPQGWKPIQEVGIGDEVFSLDEQGKLIVKQVDQIHAQDYTGDLIKLNSRGLRMVCTPNHKIAKVGGVVGDRNKAYTLLPFDELPGDCHILRTSLDFEGQEIDSFTAPYYPTRKRKLEQPTKITGDQYAELMGWFLSEGHVYPGKTSKAFNIAQLKEPYRSQIKELLDTCGFTYHTAKYGFIVSAPDWWNYFNQFGKAADKFIPSELKNASKRQLEILFTSLVNGDGSWTRSYKEKKRGERSKSQSGVYHTISEKLASDFAEIAIKLGYLVFTRVEKPSRDGLLPKHVIAFRKTNLGSSQMRLGQHRYKVETEPKYQSDVVRENFSGKVYCIGVPDTHNFVIRQDGSVWVSGNSFYNIKQYFIDPAPPRTRIIDRKTGQDRMFIPVKMENNPYIDAGYKARLSYLPPKRYKALVEGDWNVWSGEVFDLKKGIHIWSWEEFYERNGIKEEDQNGIPKHWARMMSCDWGYAVPFWFLWAAADTKGRLYIYREYGGCSRDSQGRINFNDGLRLTYEEAAAEVKKMEKDEMIHFRVIDPAERARMRGDRASLDPWGSPIQGPTGIELFAKEGLFFLPGDNNRINGIREVHRRLHYEVDKEGIIRDYPYLIFIEEETPLTQATLLALESDPKNPEDILNERNVSDHSFDCAKYLLMSRPLTTRIDLKEDRWLRKKNDRMPDGDSGWAVGF